MREHAPCLSLIFNGCVLLAPGQSARSGHAGARDRGGEQGSPATEQDAKAREGGRRKRSKDKGHKSKKHKKEKHKHHSKRKHSKHDKAKD